MLAARRMMLAGVAATIATVGSPTGTSRESTAGTTDTTTLPAGVQAGDLLIVGISGDGANPNTPTGWTAIPSGNGNQLSVFYKIAAAGETAPTITWPSNPGDRVTTTRAYRKSGGITVAASAGNAVANASTCTAGQATFTGSALCVYWWGMFKSFAIGSTLQINDASVTGDFVEQAAVEGMVSGHEQVTVAGVTPLRTAQLGNHASVTNWRGITVVLV